MKEISKKEFLAKGRFSPELAKEAGKHFINYTSYFYFGSSPKSSPFWRNNGSCFFLNGSKNFVVTCDHVVKACEEKVRESDVIQVGNFVISNLKERIIDRDPELDICTFEITKAELKLVGDNKTFLSIDSIMGRENLKSDTTLILMGYPGVFVEKESHTSISMGYISIIENIQEGNVGRSSYFIPRERENWVSYVNQFKLDPKEFKDFGGLSGGPVFYQDKFLTLFAGIIFEDGLELDAWNIRFANCIQHDGSINRT